MGGGGTITRLPLGFPMACCLLAFSMACFLCSWVMEKPRRGPQMRHLLPSETTTAFPYPLPMVLLFWHQHNLCVPCPAHSAWGPSRPHGLTSLPALSTQAEEML